MKGEPGLDKANTRGSKEQRAGMDGGVTVLRVDWGLMTEGIGGSEKNLGFSA